MTLDAGGTGDCGQRQGAARIRLGLSRLSRQRTCLQCRRSGFDPWVRKIPGEGNGNPLQCTCLENPADRGAWQTIVHGVTRVEKDLATKPSPPTQIWVSHSLVPCDELGDFRDIQSLTPALTGLAV